MHESSAITILQKSLVNRISPHSSKYKHARGIEIRAAPESDFQDPSAAEPSYHIAATPATNYLRLGIFIRLRFDPALYTRNPRGWGGRFIPHGRFGCMKWD